MNYLYVLHIAEKLGYSSEMTGNVSEDTLKVLSILDRIESLIAGPQEPPADHRIYNRKQADGTYRPLTDFFDR